MKKAFWQFLLLSRDPSVDVAFVGGGLQPGEVEQDPAGRHVLELDPHVVDLTLHRNNPGLDGRTTQEFVITWNSKYSETRL